MPLDVVKYYLGKKQGGDLNEDEFTKILNKVYFQGDDYVQKHIAEWNGLIANYVSTVSWDSIEMLVKRFKNHDLAKKLIPKITGKEINNRSSAIKAIMSSGDKELIRAFEEKYKWPERKPKIEYKSVMAGNVLIPGEGETREDYNVRLEKMTEIYMRKYVEPALSYYTPFGKKEALAWVRQQKARGIDPGAYEVKTKDGYEVYAERAKSNP